MASILWFAFLVNRKDTRPKTTPQAIKIYIELHPKAESRSRSLKSNIVSVNYSTLHQSNNIQSLQTTYHLFIPFTIISASNYCL
jgi:hypothetical protein